jgi:hypothetical protein
VLLSLWITSVVWAVEPPSLALLDDIDRWEAGQAQLISGPPGCWTLEGTARQAISLHQPPDWFSAARNEVFAYEGGFRGTLVDGVWVELVSALAKVDDHKLDLDAGVHPLIGVMPNQEEEPESASISIGDGGAQVDGSVVQGVNILTEAIEALSGSVETSMAQWDREAGAVMYLRQMPLSDTDSRPIKVDVRFPAAGALPDRIDVVWPRLIKIGEWPLIAKFRDAQAHIIGHPHADKVLPWAESASFTVGAMGFTAGWEQVLTYTKATPCAATLAPKSGGQDIPEGDQ